MQSSLQQFETGDAPNTNNELAEILSKDDKIETLTDEEIVDVWARAELARQIMHANDAVFMHSQEWEWIQDSLETGDNSVLKEIVISVAGRDSDLAQSLGWENGPGNSQTLCKEFSGRWADDEDVEIMREDVKRTARQCGTPEIEVCQARIDHLTG